MKLRYLAEWCENHLESDQGGAGGGEGEKGETEPSWITVSEAARASACMAWKISRAADNGSLKNNGKKNRERRIDAADLALWQLRMAERPEAVESDAAVRKKLKGSGGK